MANDKHESAQRALRAGVASFQEKLGDYVPSDADDLQAAIEDLAIEDVAAANMIRLALRQNSALAFIDALREATTRAP